MNSPAIYIIDDNEAVSRSLQFLFESFYEIESIIYDSPVAFLNDFSTEWQGCLITDLLMPNMSGIQLIEELEKYPCNLPVIIMSGHADEETASRALKNGAHAFIKKPFKIDILLEIIDAIFKDFIKK
ncbi:response regulator transcription factor [Legionella taurinensis]|uniref:Response regulator n=1 Tax=Legionella taurinensis TaxID=70611 RepID=A0A3A5LBL1_9GAMM|nr:response regulator [Legionella taurinensis]RJT45291.1 response regulator [Legionella taurinensis]RJT65892.1 response regulator [Legionella taurinensis]STY27147.1 sensor histidine kinase [Legionella taurinensis]